MIEVAASFPLEVLLQFLLALAIVRTWHHPAPQRVTRTASRSRSKRAR